MLSPAAGRHDVDGRHRVIDEKAEGDDEGPERNALEVDAEPFHDRENDRHRQRNRQRDDRAGRKPRLTMLTAMMMAIACRANSMNSPIAVLTTTG